MRKNNKPPYRKLGYLILLVLFFAHNFIPRGYAMDEETSFWQNYQRWFEYKKSQPLNELQKKAILYFEKANLIFEKADNTWGTSMKQPEPKPQDALKIVNKCLNEFSKLKAPSIVKKHYNATLKLIEIIRKYHLKRISNPDSSDLQLLTRSAIPYESIQSSEYFKIMRETGLFDDIEEEMKNIPQAP